MSGKWWNRPWVAKAPSPTCHVWRDGTQIECGKPATHAYPAMGGGYASLCAEHAPKHLNYCVTIEAAQRGEQPVLQEKSHV